MLSKRLVRWFFLHVVFALFPLLASSYAHHRVPTGQDWNSPELVFFTFMISTIALGDILEMTAGRESGALSQFLFMLLLLGAISSIFVYGMYVKERLDYDGLWPQMVAAKTVHAFEATVFQYSKAQAVAFVVLGTLVQILFGNIENHESKWSRTPRY
jgi:hypothetical protein